MSREALGRSVARTGGHYTGRAFSLLLAAMLAELTLAPLVTFLPRGLEMFRLMTGLVLLVAVWALGGKRPALVVFTAAVVVHLVANVWGGSSAVTVLLHLAILTYAIGLVLRRVIGAGTTTFDTVAGAACAYVLLGLIWGDLYVLVERWRPGSFEIPAAFTVGPNSDLRAALTYFSFITLTTVGYGVIHPKAPAAGGLCAAEAVVGQLYLAIMIARLIGLYTSQRAR